MSSAGQQTVRLFRALALILALALSATSAALVVVIHVPGDYATIAEALAAAPDHAVIEIAAGTYPETLVVSRPVSLRPAGSGEVLLAPAADEPVIAITDTQAVTIEGLTIVGGEHGIFVTHSKDVTIRDNIVSDSRLVGIKVRLGAADILDNTVFPRPAALRHGHSRNQYDAVAPIPRHRQSRLRPHPQRHLHQYDRHD